MIIAVCRSLPVFVYFYRCSTFFCVVFVLRTRIDESILSYRQLNPVKPSYLFLHTFSFELTCLLLERGFSQGYPMHACVFIIKVSI